MAPNSRTYNRSFAGGEISKEMFGRIDDAKFQTGAATVRNFIVAPTGAAMNRPGFAFVKATKNNGAARLIPFTFSLNQTMVIELGDGYARFHTQGATLQYSNTQRAWTVPATVTISIASPAVVTWNAHGLQNGDLAVFGPSSVNIPPYTLPSPLSTNQAYVVANATANTFQLIDPTTGLAMVTTGAGTAPAITGWRGFNRGDLVSYLGSVYYYNDDNPEFGATVPGSGGGLDRWYVLPSDLTYEIPTPYAAADLFGIHYVQSADVMTLVHQNYPPAELARNSATNWSLTAIAFGPPLATPANVAVTASPGYLAQVSSVATGGTGFTGQALITTLSSHTLALGDGVYVKNLTFTPSVGPPVVLDGFYMVDAVPVDGTGALIKNQLYLMDYNGNNLLFNASGAYSGGATIQLGTKIFNITNSYAVQAVASDGVSTSALSASASVLDNLDVPGSYNTVSWSAVAGAQSYNVYKQFNGLWGFIGNALALTFADNNIAPDFSIVPGTPDALFGSAGNYPGAVCYFQQRRCFAGTANGPDNTWMSNSGTESMFSYSLPSLDTDRIAFRVAALKADVIQHLMPMTQLLILTSESEFALTPGGANAVTPTTVGAANPQSYIGASTVQPTIINTSMVYAAARGGHVRELAYAWTVNGFMTGDLSLRAAHLFDNLTIVDQAYAKSPWPVIWFVSSSGDLLGLTYIPEEQLGAWHHHDTQGTFESVACVAEGSEDVLYAVINRTINGSTVRYVERMASRIIDPADSSTWFFVDAGVTQTFGSPVTNISGLTWLEGATVAVLADGGEQSQKTVTGGAITLDHAASVITVGLPITADLQTLPAILQLDAFGQGRMKNINKAWVKVFQASGIFVGPDVNNLTEIKQRTTEPWGSPPSLQSAELMVLTTPQWQENGQSFIRQQRPLPLSVVGLTMEVAIGG
jgi:hypothetical protein